MVAAYGTIVMPLLLLVVARRLPPERRIGRLLLVAGTWLAVCVIGGVVLTTLVMLGDSVALGLH